MTQCRGVAFLSLCSHELLSSLDARQALFDLRIVLVHVDGYRGYVQVVLKLHLNAHEIVRKLEVSVHQLLLIQKRCVWLLLGRESRNTTLDFINLSTLWEIGLAGILNDLIQGDVVFSSLDLLENLKGVNLLLN